MIKLSKRLEIIAHQVPHGARLADIGSDHALLPTYLAQRGMISFAIAGEVNLGPLEAANQQVNAAGLQAAISVRHGNGLEVIQPGEVDAITIAGMGGSLIASILESGKEKLDSVRTLILQPNVGEDEVRHWLDTNGWFLAEEAILKEDEKIYEILTAVPASHADPAAVEQLYKERVYCGDVRVDKAALLSMGPYLMEEASATWREKWESELTKLERIRQSLSRSELAEARMKQEQLKQTMISIREVLECLPKVRR